MAAPTHTSLPNEAISIPPNRMTTLPVAAAAIGIVGLAAAALLGMSDPDRFWHSYLVAVLFFVSGSLGGLFFVLLQYATRAGWSVVVRRLSEHLMATIPLMAILVLVLLGGIGALYHWSHEEAVAGDALLQHKHAYLNTAFFTIRMVVFVVTWTLIAWWFRRESLRQDQVGDPAITRRLQSLSAPALVWFGVSVTFAAFDWIMSLDAHWYSTIFGVYFFGGSFVCALAMLIVAGLFLLRRGFLENILTAEHFHDLGKLLFAFIVFWAYIGFSQFMLIWYGNIPEETEWFSHRWEHGWTNVSIALAAGHFVVPFLFLLSADVKRRRGTLLGAALWMLAMHYLDLYWLVMPNAGGFNPRLVDLACLIGVGGLFIAALVYLVRRSALVPIRDPRLSESLSFENV